MWPRLVLVLDWEVLIMKNWLIRENISFMQFMRWFDLTGLQRHLKCLGIFSRKFLRDQHPGYLQDIPRLLNYIGLVIGKYPEFSPLLQIMDKSK